MAAVNFFMPLVDCIKSSVEAPTVLNPDLSRSFADFDYVEANPRFSYSLERAVGARGREKCWQQLRC